MRSERPEKQPAWIVTNSWRTCCAADVGAHPAHSESVLDALAAECNGHQQSSSSRREARIPHAGATAAQRGVEPAVPTRVETARTRHGEAKDAQREATAHSASGGVRTGRGEDREEGDGRREQCTAATGGNARCIASCSLAVDLLPPVFLSLVAPALRSSFDERSTQRRPTDKHGPTRRRARSIRWLLSIRW